MTTYFCSGHSDLTDDEFKSYYVPQIMSILDDEPESYFIMSDYRGTDLKCCEFLLSFILPENITIYHLHDYITDSMQEIIISYPSINIAGGYASGRERDHNMTLRSDADVLWLRNPSDIPNYNSEIITRTEENIKRREIMNLKKVISYRKNWNSIFMEMCYILSKRSTCLRLKTASVIQRDNIVISIGYNGSVSGGKHCSDYWVEQYFGRDNTVSGFKDFLKSAKFYEDHHKWSTCNELHGEMNAILQAGKNGISLKNSTIFTIYSPCINCAKCIISSGIKEVYYSKMYNRDKSGVDFLKKNNVKIFNHI